MERSRRSTSPIRLRLRAAAGFTLLELVLVLILLGTLAAIALPALGGLGSTAGVVSARDQARTIRTANAANVANCRLSPGGDSCVTLDFSSCSELDGSDGALTRLLSRYDPDRFAVTTPSGSDCTADTEFPLELTPTADGAGGSVSCCLGPAE